MAYFNINKITDMHVKDIVSKVNPEQQLINLDDEIEAVCISKGVQVEDIPVDESGFITSPTLVKYAKVWLYHNILADYWGTSGLGITEDIYKAKLEYFHDMMISAKAELTADNILMRKLTQISYIKSCPIY